MQYVSPSFNGFTNAKHLTLPIPTAHNVYATQHPNYLTPHKGRICVALVSGRRESQIATLCACIATSPQTSALSIPSPTLHHMSPIAICHIAAGIMQNVQTHIIGRLCRSYPHWVSSIMALQNFGCSIRKFSRQQKHTYLYLPNPNCATQRTYMTYTYILNLRTCRFCT